MQEVSPELLKILVRKWLNGTISSHEKLLIDDWYNQQSPEEIEWDSADSTELELKTRLFNQIEANITHIPSGMTDEFAMAETKVNSLRNKTRWLRVGVAAAMLVGVGLGVSLYHNYIKENDDVAISSKQNKPVQDIAPGGNKALLIMADGTSVNLSKIKQGVTINAADLTYSDGTKVEALTVDGNKQLQPEKMLTLITPRGGQYQLVLPDGTKVWLNAASSIRFPGSFSSLRNRKVELSGEAYFEVAKNVSQPFIVASSKQEVKVLGTHFNVSAYVDETATRTTLLEGSVQVNSLSRDLYPDRNRTIIKPNEQAVLSNDNMDVVPVDAQAEVAWKNGEFVFVSEDIERILRKISRWYDVEVTYKDKLTHTTFSGSISKFENVSQVLRKIEMTNSIHFKLEGRRIIVMK